MALVGITMTLVSGESVTTWKELDTASSSVATMVASFLWKSVSQNIDFTKGFRLRVDRAPAAGETFSHTDPESLRRLVIVGIGQSNCEGRGLASLATALSTENADIVSPSTYPTDENLSGPGGDQSVGPLLWVANRLIEEGAPYDRFTIISLATGNQKLSDLYGTDGTDGAHRAQIETSVCGGSEDFLGTGFSEPILLPADDFLIVVNQGEADAASGTTTGWGAELQTYIDYITDTEFPNSSCIGVLLGGLPPSLEGGATQSDWATIAGGEQPGKHAPHAALPFIHMSYLDSGKKAGDEIHQSAAAHEQWAEDAVAAFARNAWPGSFTTASTSGFSSGVR